MAGIRWSPEDADLLPARPPGDPVSDDDRSVAADSWSIKSDYGSTVDDDQRHADAVEGFPGCSFRAASDYSSDKDAPDANEVETSLMGSQSYWNSTYAEDLANLPEHGNSSEVWFGVEVMDILVKWTKNLCASICQGLDRSDDNSCKAEPGDTFRDLSSWRVLDIGTGNGLLLQELAKQGFHDLTGVDYSERAIELAKTLAVRGGFSYINFVVDDVLETKLGRSFQLVMDKGTLDAIGLHPDFPVKRMMYWDSVSHLVAPGGILVITLCNRTKDELLQEVEQFNQQRLGSQEENSSTESAVFRYLNHVQTYPTMTLGGVDGSRITTVALVRL
ncbi:unnamed protein product [Musa acuminata subsp. burmannicoides]